MYVSDKPGNHDFQLLKRLVLSDGTLLRCTQVGRPTLDTLFEDVSRDEKTLLKVRITPSKGSKISGAQKPGQPHDWL